MMKSLRRSMKSILASGDIFRVRMKQEKINIKPYLKLRHVYFLRYCNSILPFQLQKFSVACALNTSILFSELYIQYQIF